MSADLTLPGTIPGLLRKCSPVHVDGRGGGVVVDKPSDKVGWFRVLCDGCEDEPGAESRSRVHLDLTDATGRTHAAWWALETCPHGGWPDLHTGARLWLDPNIYCGDPRISVHARAELWRILRGAGRVHDWLADLDPNDDRRLPDGSRWVDAEALRRVVLHVAGVPHE